MKSKHEKRDQKMEQNVNIKDSQDVQVIQAGRDVYYQAAGTAVKLSPGQREEFTERYLDFIASHPDYKNIRCLDIDVSLTMENYIPLQLGEERKEERQRKGKDEETKEAGDVDLRVWREEHSIGEVHSLTPVDVWRAVQNKKIVVKGDPGSGKTTLTRYIAYSLCNRNRNRRDRACPCPNARTTTKDERTTTKERTTTRVVPTDLIPLVVDLKDWAGKRDISFPEYCAKYALRESGFEKEIEPLIIDWLKGGKCILLCDGLDEVTQQNKEFVIQSLQNLTAGEYRNCHILVTTRIVGYSNELFGWKHYEVMPLKKENIEQYAGDYLKDKSPSFLSALKNTPQMEPLSKNPLLLQILCFVFDKHKLVLPAGRVELYEKAVREMLKRRNPLIPSSVKEKVLQKIAFSFLEQGKEVFEEEDLRKTIKGFLKAEEEDYRVDDVLKEIVDGSGLLCRFGDGRYIFLHLTFEEYFCACYIVGQASCLSSCLSFLEPVLFNPRFREVVRLTAGMLPKDEAGRFIEFILRQKPLCYDVLHQPLLLAGLCIADIPDKATPMEEKILDELWGLWNKTKFDPQRGEINRVFAALAGGRNGEKIINNMLGRLEDEKSYVRRDAASALVELGRADDKVVDALIGQLEDEDFDVRNDAYSSLQKLAENQAMERPVRLPSSISQISIDTFSQQNQATIKQLAQKFSTYQNRTTPITEEAINDWLLQFDNLSWMKLALKLLERIDYYTPLRMKEMFRHFHQQIIPEEDKSKVVVSLLGDLKDSSSLVNYTLGEVIMDYKIEAQPLETILNNMNPEEKVIVFVDDNIGSGKQAVQIFREWLGIGERVLKESHVLPLSTYQIEKFNRFKIYLCTFVGFEEGKERVSNELKEMGLNIGKIYSFKKEEEAIGCFHPASDIFGSPQEREEAEKMAKDIGIQLFGDKGWTDELKEERSLGYGNSQKLIIFFYNTPTSTLPILWKEGEYNGNRWQALFPRREKK